MRQNSSDRGGGSVARLNGRIVICAGGAEINLSPWSQHVFGAVWIRLQRHAQVLRRRRANQPTRRFVPNRVQGRTDRENRPGGTFRFHVEMEVDCQGIFGPAKRIKSCTSGNQQRDRSHAGRAQKKPRTRRGFKK